MTLPRSSRLTSPAQFRTVFQRPVVSSDDCFKVLARRNGATGSRLGLAVSRKVDRRAVERNRLKRLVRESFRSHVLGGQDTVPADFIVLPRRAAVGLPNARLRERLARHWDRLNRRLHPEPANAAEDRHRT